MACGYKPTTLYRLHKYTQANRAYCFTVARIYLVLRAPKYFPLGGSRALSSTAMVGFALPTGKNKMGVEPISTLHRVCITELLLVHILGALFFVYSSTFTKQKLLSAPMAGALRIELRPDDLESSALTFTLHPNMVGGPGLPWAAAVPTNLACRLILASGLFCYNHRHHSRWEDFWVEQELNLRFHSPMARWVTTLRQPI